MPEDVNKSTEENQHDEILEKRLHDEKNYNIYEIGRSNYFKNLNWFCCFFFLLTFVGVMVLLQIYADIGIVNK